MKNLLLKKVEKNCILLITLISGSLGYAQSSQSFTTSGSVVIPSGVTSVVVETWGAGGGGGSSNNTATNGGSGGGGGAYAKSTHTLTPGSTYYYNAGTIGTGGPANSTTPATAGTASWFNSNASTNSIPANVSNGTLAAGGGAGVNNSPAAPTNGGTVASSFGNTTVTAGGNGSTGANNGGGAGGSSPNGGTGGPGTTTSDGSNGNPPGGGGGGGNDAAANKGGDGAVGQVKFTWTCPSYALTNTTGTSPICTSAATSQINLTGSTSGLPIGTYTVTYSRSSPFATGLTASMTVTVAGTGSFTATGLSTAGNSTITVTNLASGSGTSCSSVISSNNSSVITVNPNNTITLSSGAGTNNQTRCINTAMTNITFTTVSATGATFSGLPAGVTGNWAANVVTISGTPSASGTFNYTVTLTGGCGPLTTATGTITVNPNNTVSLTSAVGTDNQTRCINTAITNITYSTTSATGATFSGLPAGVTGNWAANVVTISGTPTASGTFNYTVTLTGGCGTITATGTITVTPNNTITLSSGAGTNNQTTCINTAMTNITFTTVSATGATFSGLPAGVNGNWAANVVTISGTPTASGTFNYTVTLTGGCGPLTTATGTITVTPNNTISLTSAVGTNAQTRCINTAITNITYSTTSATGATFSGLPAGVNGAWAANVVTISGTPSASGTFNYTVTLTGGCGPLTTATGTITVNPNNTVSLTSAVGTDNQTRCINTAITNITYSTTSATGATFSGLPAGVTGNWAANVVTISGTPTASGTFNYTVTLTGGCGTITATGTITVTPNNTITLSSGAGTNNQTRCINTAMTNITFTTVSATGATFSGLPAGVNGNWAANVVTISGTPTASGTFNYTVTLTGGCGPLTTATGTITVNPNNTVSLTSAVGTDNQTRCINTAITNITYSTTSATGATFSGLPAGVTGNWAANVVTISGTPTASGTFNYTVTLTGGCGTITATGTITVTPNNTITLSSGAGTNNQTRCINTAMTNITFTTVSATGATFSGLPAGVTGNWAANVVTISGTPSASGTFNYTVTLTGGCGPLTTATGTITVNPNNTVSLTSAVGTDNQTRCINTAITNITYSTTSATGATFSGLPAGVTGNWAANVVTISGTPTASGTFNYTVTLTGGCGTITATGTITVNINTSGAASSSPTLCINTPLTAITHATTGATGIGAPSLLPTGVSASWASNTITISGTPTNSGTFNYSIPLTGGCGSVNATGTIIVIPNNTITLSSAVGTNAQTRCINTAITNITYNTVSATGATFSGLPAGVNGAWAANVVTISGTPSASGTFNYTVTLTGGCGPLTTATGTITVNPNNTATLTSAVGTDNQTICLATAITNITYTTTSATGATFSGLPFGVTGNWAANVVTISGTALAAGTFNYTVTLTGGCGSITATGTITVNTNNSITLSSGAGTNNQTRCINTAITNITYTTVSATGAIFSGLPAGVTGAWAANVVTISGTPTASGTFNYTVTLTGGCGILTTASGTITVNPNNTVSLTSAAGTNAQTRCINTAITNITYSTTSATGATFSGLPAGVNGAWATNVVTISGTPTASGTFNYTVTLTGGCGTITATGTITVTPNNTITLSSGAGTNNQTRCINTAMTNITFNTVSATGATFSGLPAGVTGNWAANVVTISGTPTASGTFNYTVTLTGGCGPLTTATGTITVNPNNTISLSSAVGTDNQAKCINTVITNITYSTTSATGATFSGLPAGVNGAWAANVVTISGTPTASGTFNYTVTLTGGCGTITATGTITVNPNNTVTLTSAVGTNAQTICINTTITNITYSTVSATGATFSGLPAGVTGAWAANVVTISGTPSASGTFNYTVTLTGGCGPLTTATGTITVNAMPTITSTTPGSRTGTGTLTLGATASIGTIFWYANLTGGSSLGSGTSFTTPSISTTTTYYVEAVNGACTSTPRTPVTATINYAEIDIQGNATSIVDGDTTPTTTDWTDFGTLNTTRTFTIYNTGASALNIGTATISGVNASEFTITSAPNSVVGIGSSTTFTITFNPTAVGIRTATISIVNNDPNENPYDFTIQGTGVEQEIDIQGNAISIVDGDTTPTTADWTDFSTVAATRTFTIRNTGNIVLNIGAITISGLNASDFTITTPPSATVPAFGTTTFTVSFSPSVINNRTATINIVNDDATENPYDFAIQGYGIIAEIDIQGNATSIVDGDITPTTADWTDFSSVASTRTFTIYNNGNFPLSIGTITMSGTNASEFTVTTPPSTTVAAFGSTTFVMTFLPTALGTRTARISIVNNDGNENPYDFSVQGTGVVQEIDLQGLSISIVDGDTVPSVSDGTDFGPADINLATVNRTFSILNTGSLPLTISNPTISGTNAADFSISTNPGTLSIAAGSSTTFVVTFNPSGVFTRVATINIVNNDSNENPYDFAIQGTGLLDNDGDGIENNTDQDDDNDGIIDTVECGTCISDPFVNGSFEAPVIGTSTYSIEPSANVTGWNNSAENFIEIWSTGFNGVPSAAGNQFAELNANVAGNLYQTFCLNGAGGSINWAIKHRGRSGTDVAEVRFGPSLASLTTVATMTDGNTSWGSYSGTYNIPVGQTSIVLAFTAVSSTGGLSYGNFIDDVQIIINQNCIDSDGDGVADLLDVDDENDGIPDIEEAGFKGYSNNKSVMDRSSSTTWVDANANGLNDYIEAKITAGTYLLPDTDGDGVKDYMDLDSDNDTAFDVDEAGILNGDGDINGDGKGDGADSDGDGLLNLYDNSTAFGTTTRAYAQDTDTNGIADYKDLDSNDDGVNDIKAGLYGSLDANNDGRIDGSGDADGDGITDTFDTNTAVKGSPRDLSRKLFLDFDGRNDYAENTAILGGLSNASLMAWIDLNSAFSATGVVVGQDKFQIRVSSSKTLQAIVNSTTLTFATPLTTSRWYHVAATYGGGNLNLYLNGKLVATQAVSGSIAADATKLTLGKNPLSSTDYFKGKIDEVRVFNTALTNTQVERMVYQEIQNTASQVRGAIVPKDIGSLPFANVLRYYKMDTYKDDIVDDLTTASIDTGTGMKMYNHKVINVQQAPMPFVTSTTGTFSTAVNDASNDIRGLDVYDYDYSIIQVKHNITETTNSVDLAMFVDPGVTVSMTNNTKLQNDWYLKLDGKIDLVGKSQFVQTANSDLDVTSAGSLERDQQGQSNKYNYNYWSSPVSSINSTTINHGCTVAGVMKDGTDPNNIQSLQWTTGTNGSPTTPITLSSYWIFKFQNSSNSYANWSSVGQNGALLPGQGFTMKGCGSAAADQNYTFVGKPNNGTITSTVGPNNLNLCGNPYPSAIDADQFIDDNVSSIKGTLYIWQHYSTNSSHATAQYQGGYATYTKTGGTAPVAPAGVSGLGSSSKTPKRFIPVGQGFFVTGSATGGTITFNNGQRLFVKEDDATSYSMFKQNDGPVSVTNPAFDNRNDSFTEEQFMKLRIGYNSGDNYHRQILLGFMNQHATSGFDNGYDGLSIETLTNDMYFINGTDKLNINGDGAFNVNNIYPLGVKNAVAGNVSFVVDAKENFSDSQEIYIYDNVTSIYHSIKDQNFQINLPVGTYDTRFSLRFTNGSSLGTVDHEANHGISVIHSQANNMINIKNELQEVAVKSVSLYNLLGQEVQTWKVYNQNQADMQLRITDLSTGTYIVKVITDNGDITKKIIIQ